MSNISHSVHPPLWGYGFASTIAAVIRNSSVITAVPWRSHHDGILDRIDSLLLVLPAVALYFALILR